MTKGPGKDQVKLTLRFKGQEVTESIIVGDSDWDCDEEEIRVDMVDGKYTTTIHYPMTGLSFWAVRRLKEDN